MARLFGPPPPPSRCLNQCERPSSRCLTTTGSSSHPHDQPITCVIAREAASRPDGVLQPFCTVLHEPSTLLRGSADGIWCSQDPGGQWLPVSECPRQRPNYYQLACAAATALGDRLRARAADTEGQARALAGQSLIPRPILLLLGPRQALHRLPLMPADGHGEVVPAASKPG